MSGSSSVSDQVLDGFQKPLYLYLSREKESPCFCGLVICLSLSPSVYLSTNHHLSIAYILYAHIHAHNVINVIWLFFFIPRKQYHLESFFTLSTFLLFIFCGTSIIWCIYNQFSLESSWRSPQALESHFPLIWGMAWNFRMYRCPLVACGGCSGRRMQSLPRPFENQPRRLSHLHSVWFLFFLRCIGSLHVAQAGLRRMFLLPQSPSYQYFLFRLQFIHQVIIWASSNRMSFVFLPLCCELIGACNLLKGSEWYKNTKICSHC